MEDGPTRDAPPPTFGEDGEPLLALHNYAPEGDVGLADGDQLAPQGQTGRTLLLRVADAASHLLAFITMDGAVPAHGDAPPPHFFGEHGALDAEVELYGDQAPQGQQAGRTLLLRVADAASRLLCAIAREPLFRDVTPFLPGSHELTVAVGAALYLFARPAHHQGVPAHHEEHGPRTWVRGARLLLPFAPAAAYLAAAAFTDNPALLILGPFSVDLANALAGVMFFVALVAFAALPPQ